MAAHYTFDIASTITSRIDSLDWPAIHASLNQFGWAKTGAILTPDDCSDLCNMYHD